MNEYIDDLIIDNPINWGNSFTKLMSFLNCISFVHPSCARISLSYSFEHSNIEIDIEPLRIARSGEFKWNEKLSDEEIANHLKCNKKEAASLSESLKKFQNAIEGKIKGNPDFAKDWGTKNLIISRSERWDQRHNDGINRSIDQSELIEKFFFKSSESLPKWTEEQALKAQTWLSKELKDLCQEIACEIQANLLDDFLIVKKNLNSHANSAQKEIGEETSKRKLRI